MANYLAYTANSGKKIEAELTSYQYTYNIPEGNNSAPTLTEAYSNIRVEISQGRNKGNFALVVVEANVHLKELRKQTGADNYMGTVELTINHPEESEPVVVTARGWLKGMHSSGSDSDHHLSLDFAIAEWPGPKQADDGIQGPIVSVG